MKPNQHPAHALTKQERIDIIRHLLRPCLHRGKLHMPKDTYFEDKGLELLANDISYWLGHKHLKIQVELTDQSEPTHIPWHTTTTVSGGIIAIDKRLAHSSPFMAAYYTVLGVLQLMVWRYNHTKLNTASEHTLLEHMSIEAGLGIYGLNACSQPAIEKFSIKKPVENLFQSISAETYIEWFLSYTSQHRIHETAYERYLLPQAKKKLHIAKTADDPASPTYITAFQKRLHKKYQILWFICVSGIFLMALLALLWLYLPRQLTAEQQQLIVQAQELKTAHETCQSELQTLTDSVNNPDILSSQSLRAKHNSCEKLRLQHNKIVNQLKGSRSKL